MTLGHLPLSSETFPGRAKITVPANRVFGENGAKRYPEFFRKNHDGGVSLKQMQDELRQHVLDPVLSAEDG